MNIKSTKLMIKPEFQESYTEDIKEIPTVVDALGY